MRSFKAGYKRAGWGESIIIVWLNDKGRKWRHVPFGLDVPGSWIGIRSFLAILKIYDNFATDSACLDNAIKFVVKIHIKPAYVVESQYPIKKNDYIMEVSITKSLTLKHTLHSHIIYRFSSRKDSLCKHQY